MTIDNSLLSSTLLYQNKKIHYRSYGSGKPVLFIHGFGEDSNIWNDIIDHLKDRYFLIVPDLPGSGQSEMTGDMSMEGMAEVMMAVLKASLASEGEASLIGHSMGGYIALAFAEKFPQAYSALGLFHSTAFADSEEKKSTRRKGIAFIREHGAHAFLKTVIPNLFSPGFKEENPSIIQKFIEEQHNFSPEALVSYYEAMMARPDRTPVLQKTAEPVLFIMGKYDNAVPLDDVLKQSHLPEKSYIHILRNSGHLGMMEEPVACNRILDKFLLEI